MWSKGTLGSTWTTYDDQTHDEEECTATRDGNVTDVSSGVEEDEMTYEEYETSTRLGGEEEEEEGKSALGQESTYSPEQSHSCAEGTWMCHPYKIELLEQQLFRNSPGSTRRNAVIEVLRQVGVKVFVIDSKSTHTTEDVVAHVKRVVGFVSRENTVVPKSGPLGFQRCLLYQDEQGRLFNLMVSKHAIGPAGTWVEQLDSFSGCEAMCAVTVLCRSFPCLVNTEVAINLRPAFITLVLGLVLTEEMSLSWLNASMMVRSTPSVSAHYLSAHFGADSLRKIVLFCLALAAASTGWFSTALTMVGIIGAVLIMLANLGSRSWHFMRWKPLRYDGYGAFFVAYVVAIGTGLILPYMGHRRVATGGKGGMEYVIKTAIIVAIIFVLSDLDQIQQFFVVGSQYCNQNPVNFSVGFWWTATLLASLFMVRRIPVLHQKPENGEKILIEDQASPVGYKVPSLPDFEIDPSLANTGSKRVSLKVEFYFGIIMALGVGGVIVAFAFTDWEENANSRLSSAFASAGEKLDNFF